MAALLRELSDMHTFRPRMRGCSERLTRRGEVSRGALEEMFLWEEDVCRFVDVAGSVVVSVSLLFEGEVQSFHQIKWFTESLK